MSLRIALVGYGKMGRMVEAEAVARGHEIVARIDRENSAELARLTPESADVAIEFTQPEPAPENFRTLLTQGIPVVTGTTGWLSRLPEVRAWAEARGTALLYSSNFSPGVNILFQLNSLLARLMNAHAEYDPYVEERHHRHKKDAPSGTALTLGEQILRELDRKTTMAGPELQNRPPLPDELSMGWTRAGEIVGEHTISWTSGVDRITLQHEAFNRRGFALGAVLAAEWLPGKQGIFNFSEIFEIQGPGPRN